MPQSQARSLKSIVWSLIPRIDPPNPGPKAQFQGSISQIGFGGIDPWNWVSSKSRDCRKVGLRPCICGIYLWKWALDPRVGEASVDLGAQSLRSFIRTRWKQTSPNTVEFVYWLWVEELFLLYFAYVAQFYSQTAMNLTFGLCYFSL